MIIMNRPSLQNDVLLVAVGIVGVFGALLMLYTSFNFGDQKSLNKNADIIVKKSQILATVSTRDFLTQPEKDAIIKELIGEKIKEFKFSQDEIDRILSILNKN